MSDDKDRVILRRWRSKPYEIIAIFPDQPGTNDPYTCNSYQHVGQHGACDWRVIVDRTTALPAKFMPDDAQDLLAELESIGYCPVVIRRMPRDSLAIRRAAIKAMDALDEIAVRAMP